MKLAELPTNEDCDRFYFLALRMFNPKERLAIIDDAISQIEGLGFVVNPKQAGYGFIAIIIP